MPIDVTGTKPGLVNEESEVEKIHMSCKNPNCDSMLVVEVKVTGQDPSSRMYKCVKCHMTRSIAVGGSVNL